MATILIVDDRAENREFVTAVLRDQGHRLLEAGDGAEALEIARAERPDLIITDILMPTMDGYQFMGQLRADPNLGETRVIFLTASFVESEVLALARICDVSNYIVKPVQPEVLLDSVSKVLAERILPETELRGGNEDSIGEYTQLMTSKLHQQIAEKDHLKKQMDQRVAESILQLEKARVALEQEIIASRQVEEELRHANDLLREQAFIDTLTGLCNRRYLEASFDRELSRASRSDTRVGVFIIDIDNFKRCNDTFGHAAGDAVLKAVGQYMQSLTRKEDIACRYGGEEFVLIMSQVSDDIIVRRAEKLREGVEKLRVEYEGRNVGAVTVSIGIAVYPDHGTNMVALMQAADIALYRAKQAGRNRSVMFDTTMK